MNEERNAASERVYCHGVVWTDHLPDVWMTSVLTRKGVK